VLTIYTGGYSSSYTNRGSSCQYLQLYAQELTAGMDGVRAIGSSMVIDPVEETLVKSVKINRRWVGNAAAGLGLTVESGGALAGATDAAGGALNLKSGIATGDGGSDIYFYTVRSGQGAGTTDRSPVAVANIKGGGVLSLYQSLTSHPAATANQVKLYGVDLGAGAELYAMDEAGNTTLLSPHNAQALKLCDPDDPYPWVYYAENRFLGIRRMVDIAGVVSAVEKLTGKKFVHDVAIPAIDWDQHQLDLAAARDQEIDGFRRLAAERDKEISRLEAEIAAEADHTVIAAQNKELNRLLAAGPVDAPPPYTPKPAPSWLKQRLSKKQKTTPGR
jgi:hypothetical protein